MVRLDVYVGPDMDGFAWLVGPNVACRA